eukprot:s4208_g1.t1
MHYLMPQLTSTSHDTSTAAKGGVSFVCTLLLSVLLLPCVISCMYRQLSPAATTDFHLLRLEQAKAAYVPCAGIAQENDMLFDQERRKTTCYSIRNGGGAALVAYVPCDGIVPENDMLFDQEWW